MAAEPAKKVCATCRKSGDVFTCRGCRRAFCPQHVDEHREKLAKEVENLAEQHETLHREINRDTESQLLLAVINTWEQESIAKITHAAETARNELQKWLERNNLEIKVPFERITNELRACQQSDDYTETDLRRWLKQLEEYRDKLERLPIIDSTDEDTAETIHLIKLIDPRDKKEPEVASPLNETFNRSSISTMDVPEPILLVRERFNEIHGGLTTSDDGLVLSYASVWVGDSSACGVNVYSSGTHHIRFRILEKFYDAPFFGIITATQKNVDRILDTISANGWRNFDYPVENGEKDEHIRHDRLVRTFDELTLTLDCDRKQIFLKHHRSKRLLQMPIDLRNCPFPWKMLVVLHRRGDSVRIIGGTLSLTRDNLSSRLSDKRRT